MTDLGRDGMQLLARWLSGVYVSFVSYANRNQSNQPTEEKHARFRPICNFRFTAFENGGLILCFRPSP